MRVHVRGEVRLPGAICLVKNGFGSINTAEPYPGVERDLTEAPCGICTRPACKRQGLNHSRIVCVDKSETLRSSIGAS